MIIKFKIFVQRKNQIVMEKYIEKGLTFDEYYNQIDSMVKEGKTSGENQTEDLIEYTRVNQKRMKKWRKIYKTSSEWIKAVQSLERKEEWILLTESWCGDAAQNISQINNMVEVSDKLDLKILYRDENLDLMDQFLTNGGRAIPKLIRLDAETKQVIGSWGPRVRNAQEIVINGKKNGSNYGEELHTWYAKNKSVDLENEFIELIKKD